MNLVLLESEEVEQGRVLLTGRRAEHLLGVLHVKPGDVLRVGLLDGPLGQAVVEKIHDKKVALRCTFDDELPIEPEVDLILALPRPKVLRRMWAPMASLKVRHIALTNAWRVERNYFDTHLLLPANYEPLLKQGLEQAGHTRMPTVSIHKRLVELLEDEFKELFDPALDAQFRLLAHPEAKDGISKILLNSKAKSVLLAVGPEGGWIDRELVLFERAGFLPVSLGGSILRSDLATYVLLGITNELRQE